MKDVKGASSKWINDSRFLKHHFEWQSGYGAFSYNASDIPRVINYIEKQEEHHRKISFKTEYRDFLEEYQIDYNERFVFHDPA